MTWRRGRRGRDDRGVAAIITVSAFVVLLGFVALALDLGRGYLLRTRLHQAVEMAAEAGAGSYDRDALDATGVPGLDVQLAEQRALTTLQANLPDGTELESWEVMVLDDGQGGGGVAPDTGDIYDAPTVIVTATASITPLFTLSSAIPQGDRITVRVRATAGQKFRFEQ